MGALDGYDVYARELRIRMAQGKKPIDLGKKSATMNIKIHWGKGLHADPDNVWKGIADSLFQNDREVDGCFRYENAQDKRGFVEVGIVFN